MSARLHTAAALLALCALLSAGKYHHAISRSVYDPTHAEGLFWTEEALHYRYARMVARGETIPQLDTAIQYPEGFRPFTQETIAMEVVAGLAYRVAKRFGYRARFHSFVLLFVAVASSLVLIPIYGFSRLLWTRRSVALATTTLAVAVYPLHARAAWLFIRENFALPILLLGLWLVLRGICSTSQQQREMGLRTSGCGDVPLFVRLRLWADPLVHHGGTIIGVACLCGGLYSWHFAPFMLLPFWGATLGTLAWGPPRPHVTRRLLALIVVLIALGLSVPHLRESRFALSLHTVLPGLALLAVVARERMSLNRSTTTALLIAASTAAVFVTHKARGPESAQGHVYETLMAKLGHLGVKPEDPHALSFTARLMWVKPDNTLSLSDVLTQLLPMVLLASVGLFMLRKRLRLESIVVATYAGCFGVLFLLFQRMQPQFFATAMALCGWAFTGGLLRVRAAVALLVVAVFFMPQWGSLPWTSSLAARIEQWAPQSRFPIRSDVSDVRELYRFARNRTPAEARFLTTMQVGPGIVLHSNRSALMHAKVENVAIRKKYEHFVTALYDSEQALYDFCRRHGATHFVYQIDMALDASREGLRFLGGKRHLRRDSFVYRLHFRPHELRHFEPVMQTAYVRVFSVLPEGETVRGTRALPSYRIWDEDAFSDLSTAAMLPRREADRHLAHFAEDPHPSVEFLDDRHTERHGLLREGARHYVDRALRLHDSGDAARSRAAFDRALSLAPDAYGIYVHAARAEMERGNHDRALHLAEQGLEKHPALLELLEMQVTLDGQLRRRERELAAAEQCLSVEPTSAPCATAMGRALIARKRLDDATALLEPVARQHEVVPEIWWLLGVARQRQGRPGLALTAFSRVRDLRPDFKDVGEKIAAMRVAVRGSP